MNIIVDKLTNVVKYFGEVTLTDAMVVGKHFTDSNTSTVNSYIVDVAEYPSDLVGGVFKFSEGSFSYATEELRLEYLSREAELRCDAVDKLRLSKTYTDVEVTFPTGKKYVQFRDEFDRANLANVSQAAQMLVINGSAGEIVPYRTADNVTQLPTAEELLGVAGEVMAAKQAIVTKAWEHKDNLRSLATIEDVRAYNIFSGW